MRSRKGTLIVRSTVLTVVLGIGVALVPSGTAFAEESSAEPSFPVAMAYGVGSPLTADSGMQPDDPASGMIVSDPQIVSPTAGTNDSGDLVETDDLSPSTIDAASNPANCVQQANNPHVSAYESYNGKPLVKGEVRTTCAYRINHLYQTAQLWEKRYWGWDRIGSKGVYDKDYPTTTVQTFGRVDCRNNKMRTTGYGEATIGGTRYYAQTESSHVKIKCPSSNVYIGTVDAELVLP